MSTPPSQLPGICLGCHKDYSRKSSWRRHCRSSPSCSDAGWKVWNESNHSVIHQKRPAAETTFHSSEAGGLTIIIENPAYVDSLTSSSSIPDLGDMESPTLIDGFLHSNNTSRMPSMQSSSSSSPLAPESWPYHLPPLQSFNPENPTWINDHLEDSSMPSVVSVTNDLNCMQSRSPVKLDCGSWDTPLPYLPSPASLPGSPFENYAESNMLLSVSQPLLNGSAGLRQSSSFVSNSAVHGVGPSQLWHEGASLHSVDLSHLNSVDKMSMSTDDPTYDTALVPSNPYYV